MIMRKQELNTENVMRIGKKKKWVWLIIFGFTILLILINIFGGNYLFNYAIVSNLRAKSSYVKKGMENRGKLEKSSEIARI